MPISITKLNRAGRKEIFADNFPDSSRVYVYKEMCLDDRLHKTTGRTF